MSAVIGLVFAAPLALLPAFVQRGRSNPRFRWTVIVVVALLVSLIAYLGYAYMSARIGMVFLSVSNCDTFDNSASCLNSPPEPEYSQLIRELGLRYALPPTQTCYGTAELCEKIDASSDLNLQQDWTRFWSSILYSLPAGFAGGALLWLETRTLRKRKTDE